MKKPRTKKTEQIKREYSGFNEYTFFYKMAALIAFVLLFIEMCVKP